MKLLPFDIEKAKAGHKIVTRDGQSVSFLMSRNEARYTRPLTIWHNTNHQILHYLNTGRYYEEDTCTIDLFLVDEFTDAQRYQLIRDSLCANSPDELEKYEAPFKKALADAGFNPDDYDGEIKSEFFDFAVDTILRIKLEQQS